jgi:hypothetical protein
MAKEADDDLYADILNYVTGKPNGFERETVGMTKAKIAKTLVKRDPKLLAPIKRNALLKAVNAIYDRDNAIIVTLTKRDLALARTRSTWPARYRKASRHLRRKAAR